MNTSPILFDLVLSSKFPKNRRTNQNIIESRRGIKGPIYCYHCQRKIKGYVYWIKLKPFCHYCYGFRAILIPAMKDELPDHLKKKLREKVHEDQEMNENKI